MDMYPAEQFKTISYELEHIVYNIAEKDLAKGKWASCMDSVLQRIASDDIQVQMVGLSALKEMVRAYMYEIDEQRKVLIQMAAAFFGVLE